ncbi:MAG: hypothetical protein CMO55_22645 [Verrucomicrobiales bacterium]|nr:hypothetical protein [Verrucomicrobiales bacterium]
MNRSLCIFLFLLNFLVPLTLRADWPGFLGPDRKASSDSHDNGILSDLGKKSPHLRWKIPSGKGHSSPCITGDFLFLTSTEDGGKTLVMTAYNRKTGEVLWRQKAEGEVEDYFGHLAADPAAPTPCTNGEVVVFYFGGYGLIARDVETGDLKWEKPYPFQPKTFSVGTSPILTDHGVVVNRDGTSNSSIQCFNIDDGSLLWEIPRPGFRGTYASPYLWKNSQRTELVVPGMNSLRAYSPADGSPLWQVEDLCVFPCTTPVADKDQLYFAAWATPNADSEEKLEQSFWGDLEFEPGETDDPNWIFKRFDKNNDNRIVREELPESRMLDVFAFIDRDQNGYWTPEEPTAVISSTAPGRNLMVAISAGHDGTLTEGQGIAWTYDNGKALPYVSSPLLLNDRVYLAKTGGILTCLDAKSGNPVFGPKRCNVGGEYYSSPVGWGDKVIHCAKQGVALILQEGDELNVLAEHNLEEEIYASPAIVDGTLYIRTRDHLWAFGESD